MAYTASDRPGVNRTFQSASGPAAPGVAYIFGAGKPAGADMIPRTSVVLTTRILLRSDKEFVRLGVVTWQVVNDEDTMHCQRGDHIAVSVYSLVPRSV